MNCSDVDLVVDAVPDFFVDTDFGFSVGMFLLLSLSILLVVRGEKIVRPVSVLLGGAGGAVATYALFLDSLSCVQRLIVSAVAGVSASLLVLCLLGNGIALLGGVASGTVVHLVYHSLPLDSVSPPFEVSGTSGVYLLAVGGSFLAGGIVSCIYRSSLLRIVSSLVGGSGLSLLVYLVVERWDGSSVPSAVLLLLIGVTCPVGYWIQGRRTTHDRQ